MQTETCSHKRRQLLLAEQSIDNLDNGTNSFSTADTQTLGWNNVLNNLVGAC
jgi:hypothetical protein